VTLKGTPPGDRYSVTHTMLVNFIYIYFCYIYTFQKGMTRDWSCKLVFWLETFYATQHILLWL